MKLDYDYSVLGLEQREESVTYYCTPENAEIIGWAGVDGIHYCTIPRFGNMIFAVSPMNFANCVQPIAYSFRDLLRLLMTCGDMAVLEQCHGWSLSQYRSFLKEYPITKEQQDLLDKIRVEQKIKPIKNAFQYVKTIQAEFDYSAIPFSDAYYDCTQNPNSPLYDMKWDVSFSGGFWDSQGMPGVEVSLNKTYTWGDEHWHALSAYICEEGMVIDFGVEVRLNQLNAFLDKWELRNGELDAHTKVEQEMIRDENPMEIHFRSTLVCNGMPLKSQSGCSITWVPSTCDMAEPPHDFAARRFLHHYGLNIHQAWVLWRCSYRWNGQKDSDIHSLRLSMKRDAKRFIGQSFVCPEAGETVDLTSPISGKVFRMNVLEIEQAEIQETMLPDRILEYPTHCLKMRYSIEPEMQENTFTLLDFSCSDSPRLRIHSPNNCGAAMAAVGLIGGEDGPTTVIYGSPVGNQNYDHYTYSSLHFEPVEKVEWSPIFLVKEFDDILVELL